MKNLKITLSNNYCHVMLNTTREKAMKHAKDVRFNPEKLNFEINEATQLEVENEKERLAKNKAEYDAICKENTKIDRYNSAVAKAKNHHEFMNAAKHLR